MVRTNEEYLSNSLEYVYKPEIGQRKEYTAITGTAIMSTANANLDGTGTLYAVLTASASGNGALIKTVTIKGTMSVTRGMVRLFIMDGAQTPTTNLVAEIEIPAISQATIQRTFAISMEVDFMLQSRWSLMASTENGSENIVVIAEGLDLAFP